MGVPRRRVLLDHGRPRIVLARLSGGLVMQREDPAINRAKIRLIIIFRRSGLLDKLGSVSKRKGFIF